MTDIKQTLATAFDDEPPLTIDRAAIVKSGRRKAIFRRGWTGAAVLAAVAAVCVPAMLGSGGGGDAAQVGAGGSSTAPPLVTGSSTVTSAPGSSTPASGGLTTTLKTTSIGTSVSQPPPPKPPTPERAAELSSLLASSGVIPADARSTSYPGFPTDPWEFAADRSGYRSIADVTTAAGRGRVMIDLGGGEGPRCDPTYNTAKSTCEMKVFDGQPVVVIVRTSDDPRPVTFIGVSLRKPDGTVVEATAMNGNAEKTGVTGPNPPLTYEQLVKIATLPGLTF